MKLGECSDGRAIAYDVSLCAFSLGGRDATWAQLMALDDAGAVRWRAMEQRDWFRRIDPDELAAAQKRALASESFVPANAHEQVLADAARDDGVLAGQIVDASPALVQAVLDRLEQSGALSRAAAGSAQDGAPLNPLAHMELPDGMGPLAQMERVEGVKRSMTRTERRLMRRILRNNDKELERNRRRSEGAPKPGVSEDGEGPGPAPARPGVAEDGNSPE